MKTFLCFFSCIGMYLAPAAYGAPMPPGVSLDSTPFIAAEGGYAVYRTPAVVISSKGTVLAFCGGRVNDHKDEGDIDIVLRRSVDGGKEWGPLQILANDGPNPCKNVCPVVLPSGRILAVYLWNKSIPSEKERTTRKVYIIHSDDDGETWSSPRDITSSVYKEDWRWYGTGPCHAIVKRSEPFQGRVIVPARHNAKGSKMVSHVIYSDDEGETWRLGGDVPRRSSESTVVELSNGDLMMNCRNQNDDEQHRVVSISKDAGLTFVETRLDLALIEPRGCQGSLLFHSMNEKTQKGNILFSNPNNAQMRSNGSVKLSTDDGQTWTGVFEYAPKPAPYFTGYSDLALFPNGDIGVLYERGEVQPDDEKAERYGEMGFIVFPFDEFLKSSAS